MTELNTKSSWQFDMVYQMSLMAADHGNLKPSLKKYGYLATELYDVRVPREFQNAEGRTGVSSAYTLDPPLFLVWLARRPIISRTSSCIHSNHKWYLFSALTH
jgi:hypothetical protein